MLEFTNVRCLLFPLVSVVSLLIMEGGAQGADVSHQRTFAVGHSIRRLNVPGTLGEDRPLDVHLWYPGHSLDDCESSGNSEGNRNDQGCSATPSVYTSRLHRIPLLPQWDPLSWTIGTSGSFENLPIDRRHRPFPVIVFSHGSQNNAIDYVYTLEAAPALGSSSPPRITSITPRTTFGLISSTHRLDSR